MSVSQGKHYLWRDLLELRRDQKESQRAGAAASAIRP